MNLECWLGRHSPIKDFSNWSDGYYHSACARCGEPMKKGQRDWRTWRRTERNRPA